MLKDCKTATENDLHALLQAFQNQPNTVYGNITNEKMTDETCSFGKVAYLSKLGKMTSQIRQKSSEFIPLSQ